MFQQVLFEDWKASRIFLQYFSEKRYGLECTEYTPIISTCYAKLDSTYPCPTRSLGEENQTQCHTASWIKAMSTHSPLAGMNFSNSHTILSPSWKDMQTFCALQPLPTHTHTHTHIKHIHTNIHTKLPHAIPDTGNNIEYKLFICLFLFSWRHHAFFLGTIWVQNCLSHFPTVLQLYFISLTADICTQMRQSWLFSLAANTTPALNKLLFKVFKVIGIRIYTYQMQAKMHR